jgi:hypothetical protein
VPIAAMPNRLRLFTLIDLLPKFAFRSPDRLAGNSPGQRMPQGRSTFSSDRVENGGFP